ncbi:MAG: hypothetical protein JXM79_07295 [Sedimentisphaerales bacterium]|nr:hypothetical protein [Sedimentisphaerales bacterium]
MRFHFLIVVCLTAGVLSAYENRSPGEPNDPTKRVNSPHGIINRLALGILTSRIANQGGFMGEDDPITGYSLLPLATNPLPARTLTGESVLRCGLFYEDDELSEHGIVGQILEIENLPGYDPTKKLRAAVVEAFENARIAIGDKTLSFTDWLIEAGFTADEPELWMSLRHFYDPLTDQGLSDEHYLLAAAMFKAGDLVLERPKMNARTWALTGPAQQLFTENEWSWEKGVKTMETATACTSSPAERDRLFVSSWRALGETMHLLADMTVPAHVRNDAHAYKTAAGSLGPDPYEVFATEALVGEIIANIVGSRISPYAAVRDQVSAKLRQDMNACKTPSELFKTVASWTNTNFFSKDTVSGTVTIDGKTITVHNANGVPDFPNPKLEDCQLDSQTVGLEPMTLYTRQIDFGTLTNHDLRRIYMTRLSWAIDNSWMGYFREKVQCRGWEPDDDVCLSQAQVLIPLAVYANTYLVDWYIPRFRIVLDDLKTDTCQLSGSVVHIPYGPHKSLVYNLPEGQQWDHLARLEIDGTMMPRKRYRISVKDGSLSCDFAPCAVTVQPTTDIRVYLDLGGIWIRSEPYEPPPPTGFWVLEEEPRIVTKRYYMPDTKSDDFSLVSTFEVEDEHRLAGGFEQHGTYFVDLNNKSAYSVSVSGEVSWQPLPRIIPGGSVWELRVSGYQKQAFQPDTDDVRVVSGERTTAHQDYSSNTAMQSWFYCQNFQDWWDQGHKGTPVANRQRKHEAQINGNFNDRVILVFRDVPMDKRNQIHRMMYTYGVHTPVGSQEVIYRYLFYPYLPKEKAKELAKVKSSSNYKGLYVKPEVK